MFNKVRYNLRFLIKIQTNNPPIAEDLFLDKALNTTLNQLGIDEASYLDDFLYSLHVEMLQGALLENPGDEGEETILSTLYYTIWRNKNLYHQIKIKPFVFYEFCFKYHDELLKYFRSYKTYKIYNTSKDLKYRIFVAIPSFFYLLEGTSWNLDSGFFFSFNKFYNSFTSVFGVQRSYSKRSEMLGRTINFRRKMRKKRFEEYQCTVYQTIYDFLLQKL